MFKIVSSERKDNFIGENENQDTNYNVIKNEVSVKYFFYNLNKFAASGRFVHI